MPCRDPNDWQLGKRTSHGMTFEHFEAALCGILTAIEGNDDEEYAQSQIRTLFSRVDWKEAGVPRRLVEIWWYKHKEADRLRAAQEAAEHQKEILRHSALSKLTSEERAALGL